MEELLNQIYYGNTVLAYAKALGFFIIGIIVIKIFKSIVLIKLKKWAEKTETTIDDFIIIGIKKSVVPILYFAALYVALNTLKLSDDASSVISIAAVFIITFFAIRLITATLDFSIVTYSSRQETGDSKAKQLKSISALARFLIWGIGLIFLLDNLGFDITAVVAGLGIGGIAVALAAQTILGDLFSYFIIFFDRPFELGDYIKIGDKNGTVEHIGIKTTRIRALTGEQLVFSNTDLTSSRLHNFKKLQRRRISFQIGVTYETPIDKVEIITEMVKKIIESEENTEYLRGHFISFGDFSLNYEFVYYVLSSDYNVYTQIQENININLLRKFNSERIEFAYPTQLVYVNKTEGAISDI